MACADGVLCTGRNMDIDTGLVLRISSLAFLDIQCTPVSEQYMACFLAGMTFVML